MHGFTNHLRSSLNLRATETDQFRITESHIDANWTVGVFGKAELLDMQRIQFNQSQLFDTCRSKIIDHIIHAIQQALFIRNFAFRNISSCKTAKPFFDSDRLFPYLILT